MKASLVLPSDFSAPEVLLADRFNLRTLTVADLVKDYTAVMGSLSHLQQHFAYCAAHSVFGPSWPSPDLTLMEDLADRPRMTRGRVPERLVLYLHSR
jgi:hypothetical protein